MKHHITKLTAIVLAVLMVLSLVPAAALSDFNLPALFSVFGGTSATDGETAPDGEAPETAIPTVDGTPVQEAGGDGLYIASNGTLYMDTDGDGTAEAISGDTIADEDFGMTVTQGKVTNDEVYQALGGTESIETVSPYEPSFNSNNEFDPFLPGGDAWINLSKIFYGAPAMPTYPITKWSANTSVYNVTAVRDANGNVTGYALPDMDLIDSSLWTSGVSVPQYFPAGAANTTIKSATKADVSKSGTTGYAYNRYDAMQGKWGVTLDKNVKTLTWTATGSRKVGGKQANNTVLYLTDTPYLYYSTEALDGTKLAISLLIGTPVQEEKGNALYDTMKGQTSVFDTPRYEYRWYTITDNAERPGISADTLDNSMTPNVTISDVVATVTGKGNGVTASDQQVSDVMAAVSANNASDPIALAVANGTSEDALYVDGSITGCIDFSNLLPLVMGSLMSGTQNDNGREDVQYKVAKVHVDTKTVAGNNDSAARINYLYFAPGQSMVYTPQTTHGSDTNAYAWMYAQKSNTNSTESNADLNGFVTDFEHDTTIERAYTSGWENGQTVTITNTPNDPQKITIDTYGQYGGELVGGQSDTYHKAFLDSKSKIWQYIDANGNRQRLEAEYNQSNDSYYVMVTIPIRKWVNVLGNSRRLSMVVTVEESGDETYGGEFYPGFVFWGNESGSHGAGHARNGFGGRYRNEDLLAMFGQDNAYYHVDYSQNFYMMEIDSTLGHSTIYNTQTMEDGYAVYETTVEGKTVNYFVKNGVVYARAQKTDANGRLVFEAADGNQYFYNTVQEKLYDANGNVSDIDPIDLDAVYNYTTADLGTVFSLTKGAKDGDYTVYTDADGNAYYKDANGTYYTRVHKENTWGAFLYTAADGKTYTKNSEGKWYSGSGTAISAAPEGATPVYNYSLAFIEKVYDKTESWYDILRSPYMYDQTVTRASERCNITEDMIGYVYISSLRFAMPVGSKITIQNMKGDGNSAGLNMYSTSGAIVSAYDGGSGSQPVTNVGATLPEQAATLKANASATDKSAETHDYATSGDGSIKGTQEDRPAAYGPYLEDSYYTIYDLLDVEQINGHGKFSDNTLAAKNPIYGTNVVSDRDLVLYSGPRADSYEYGTIKAENHIVLYASVYNGTQRWGLTGTKLKSGSPELAWFKMTSSDGKTPYTWHFGEETSTTDIYKGQNKQNKFVDLGKYADYGDGAQNGSNDDKIKLAALGKIGSNWHLSSFNTGSDMSFSNGGSNDYSHSGYTLTAEDMYLKGNARTMFAYANYSRGKNHYSAGEAADQNALVTNNNTELELREIESGSGKRGFAVSRTISAPVRLHQGATQGGYPVLHYDIGADDADAKFRIALTVVKKQAFYVRGSNGSINETDADYVGTELLYLDGANGLLSKDSGAFAPGSGYISLKKLMSQEDQEYWIGTTAATGENWYSKDTTNLYPKYVYEIAGIHVYVHRGYDGKASTLKLDRLEVLQEDTPWLDNINVSSATASNSISERVQLKDSMNILNDVFYHTHNEDKDGTYTVTQNSNGTVTINDQTKSANLKDKVLGSDIKDNSNSGWSGQITVDLDRDGQWWTDQETELFNGADGESREGVYEYRTALGHARVWVPANTNANLILTADRSFNTKNYKYLYYSYSVRDVMSGISAEDLHTSGSRTKDGKGVTGVEVAIKAQQSDSQDAYLEQNGTWVYYNEANDFLATNAPDDRSYDTTMNAAIDLSSLDNIDSINQIVFYLNNAESNTAEFYINYVTLSNVAPTALIAESLAKPQVQYYYLMDNTGDRYSARFPTIDNPTGAVTATDSDSDRNNPVVVERGKRLSEGSYFNGDPLYGYGVATGTRAFNQTKDTVGFYEKLYDGVTEATANQAENGSFKNIWFYAGVTKDKNGNEIKDNYEDITDFYTYKERNEDGSEDIYDMLWSYGRWYTGAGESGLNNMYIGNPADMHEGDTANGVSGNLVRRYATEDYVLLRSGIQPKKFTTYYNASGGQFVYENSNEQIKDKIQLDVNSYYITSTVLFSNFTYPTSGANIIEPFKYGYVFKGWRTTDNINDTNVSATEDELKKYNRKDVPGINYFYAVWERDPAFSSSKQNVAKFYVPDSGNNAAWFTRVAKYETDAAESFKIILPGITQYNDKDGVTQYIRGWREKGNEDGVIYTPGQKIVLTESVDLEPVLATNSVDNVSMTVTLFGAKLYLVTEMDANGRYTKLRDLSDGFQGIKCVGSGNTYTYTNVTRDLIVVAKPIKTNANAVWMLTQSTGNSDYAATERTVHYLNDTVGTVLSTNTADYQFSVCSDMTVSYTALDTSKAQSKEQYQDANGAVSTMISSSSAASEEGREMIFVSTFDLSNVKNAKAVAWGTLYTKNNLYKTMDMDADMRLDETSINTSSIAQGSFATKHANVRQVKASEKSLTNQYYLRVTENKGVRVQYFCRSYLIYELGGKYYVTYSNVIMKEYLPAAQ